MLRIQKPKQVCLRLFTQIYNSVVGVDAGSPTEGPQQPVPRGHSHHYTLPNLQCTPSEDFRRIYSTGDHYLSSFLLIGMFLSLSAEIEKGL